ncbi:MAG: ABC transporter permease [Gemmatimonadales bacterium]|jgi:predicted permease
MNDLRYALRQSAKRPLFTAAAVITLALGIGGTVSVFSIVEAVLLEPLSYRDADQLMVVWQRSAASGGARLRVPAPDVSDYREQARSFSDFTFTNGVFDAVLEAGPERSHARIGRVTGNFFDVLGVRTEIGRGFAHGEAILPVEAINDTTRAVPPSVLVLSHRLWQTRFGGQSEVIGETVYVNDQPMTIVGVLPPEFQWLVPPDAGMTPNVDAWTPLRIDLRFFRRDEGAWQDQDSDNTGMVIGRLRAGVTLAQARAEMETVAARQREEIPYYERAGMRLDVVPLHADIVGHARTTLLVLLGIVGTVLMVACLNVANLLLARAAGRRREMAVRSALGASRRRLVRQALVESGVLAVCGAAVGLVLASWGIGLVVAVGPADLPRRDAISINAAVLAFTSLVSLLAVAVFGTAPALESAADDKAQALRQRGPLLTGGRRVRMRQALVVSQVALSLAVLIATGLLVRSFLRLHDVRPGFDASGVLTFNVSLPGGTVGGPGARAEFMLRAHDRISALPGVEAVGLIGGLPLAGDVWIQPYGLPSQRPEEWGDSEANFRVITSDYFRAMGTRLVAGRSFTPVEDVVENERIVIIDEALARRLAPGGRVLGRSLGFPLDGRPVWARIVGVVENVRHESLREYGRPTIYVPYRQEASRTVAFAVRTAGEPLALAPPIRQAFAELSGSTPVPVYDFRSLARYVQDAMAPARFALALVGVFAGIAFVLAMVGLYGLMSHGVNQRVREIGVRLAIGARPRIVLVEVVGGGLRLVLAGLAIGIGLSLASLRVINGLLFDVPTTDPGTYLVVSLFLLLVGLFACYLPARRAARIDPMEALRHE